MILRSAAAWERIGERWFTAFAGVSIVEATKQIYAKPVAAAAPPARRALSISRWATARRARWGAELTPAATT